uniref:Coiled-coil domain containing 27 n=1 Tax=Latimeria chalumnae TaxID=7897 RepID=M3XGX4_LATCH|nr:PREDICTED: coiled-coil domain-containing protein 27 isoform X2 [Latimeria chalumnae]|eukprot:XP_014345316.1 PREDICTED: coiled-coil domain-containing protein 27 isoform X2 [Latimeria chalumnae]
MRGFNEFQRMDRRVQTPSWRGQSRDRMRTNNSKTPITDTSSKNQLSASLSQTNGSITGQTEKTSLPFIDDIQARYPTCPAIAPVFPRSRSKSNPQTCDRMEYNSTGGSDLCGNLHSQTPCGFADPIDCTEFGMQSFSPFTLQQNKDPPGFANRACRYILNQSLSEPVSHMDSLEKNSDSPVERNQTRATNATLRSCWSAKIPWYLAVLHEKEQCLLMLGDQIDRLSVFEAECMRKDGLITALRKEAGDLKQQLLQAKNGNAIRTKEETILSLGDEINRLKVFEQESQRKDDLICELREEICCLKIQLSQWQPAVPADLQTEITSSLSECVLENEEEQLLEEEYSEMHESDSQLAQKGEEELEVASLSSEKESLSEEERRQLEMSELQKINSELKEKVETLKKDYTISTGTVSSLNRSLFFQESLLRKAHSEHEKLITELRETGKQVQEMSAKFSSLRERHKNCELMGQLEKENYSLKQHVSELKSELEEKNKLAGEMKEEIRQLQQELKLERELLKQLDNEKKEIQIKLISVQHSELQTKVALEFGQSRFERFRSKIIQAAYNIPGAKVPQSKMSDSDILDNLQKIISDRTEFHEMLKQKGVKVPPLAGTELANKAKSPRKSPEQTDGS